MYEVICTDCMRGDVQTKSRSGGPLIQYEFHRCPHCGEVGKTVKYNHTMNTFEETKGRVRYVDLSDVRFEAARGTF